MSLPRMSAAVGVNTPVGENRSAPNPEGVTLAAAAIAAWADDCPAGDARCNNWGCANVPGGTPQDARAAAVADLRAQGVVYNVRAISQTVDAQGYQDCRARRMGAGLNDMFNL
ncbi:MAG TPA: hypothetical protein PKW90_01090 [Myxococcota bacterium]|nr:hypothetical protein [Myxococcota bacterium]